jgi:hypothetical protein
MSELAFGGVSGGRLRHALAFAKEIHAECVIQHRTVRRLAKRLRLDPEQCVGVLRIVRKHWPVSPERLAVIAMKDWGLDDNDIGEMFSRSPRWAAVVRSQADEIRAEEFIEPRLEYLDAGLQPGDPSPDEIRQRAAELRAASGHPQCVRWRPQVFSWTTKHAFLPCRSA